MAALPAVADAVTARTWAEVDLGAIAANVRALRARLPGTTDILMTVKADAYGHGLVPVARAARAAGIWGLGVATLDEAAALRAAEVAGPIVCLMPVLPVEAPRAVALDVTLAISAWSQAEALAAAARAAGRDLPVHLDVDTGMNRSGMRDGDAVEEIARIAKLPGLILDGMFTHFASSDASDRATTDRQIERFDAVLAELSARDIRPPRVHAANSAGALRFPRAARALVRPGIALYGAPGEIAPDAEGGPWASAGPEFRPALSWHARVLAVKELAAGDAVSYHGRYVARGAERVALLGVGYGDGWPYGLSDRGQVLLRGRPAAIRGAVCMDLTMVDATAYPDLSAGEIATLIGRQQDSAQGVEAVGQAAGLMSYAVLTGITARVHRRYLEVPSE
ncbi:MAG: alanine racemase [Gemmatimonadota bacterium]